ncbi:MAG: lipid-A-disaccharide synthase [Paludibacteraceae bacterium]|nr:lipid-A-disaccharide synthase [Paludibacteraceae bacterium]
MAKYFLIAGEASGDNHAAALIEQLKQRDQHATFCGLGGDHMAATGCRLYQNYRNMAFMGFAAVIANMNKVSRNFHIARHALLEEQPDALILIDYPSFNLRMADFCRRHLPNTKIYYYIPPKVWAWKKWRIHRIARLCDEVLAIFPFETDFYARYGYRCTYVGNPTAEAITRYLATHPNNHSLSPTTSDTIAILPGSRPSEVSHCLPVMLEAARRFPDYHIVITAAPGLDDAAYLPFLSAGEELTRDTYDCVRTARVAIVNSGTATLETALLDCPQLAVYYLTGARFIGWIRRLQPLFFSIPYFTLVNILSGKETIRELVANDFSADNIETELHRLLTSSDATRAMHSDYEQIRLLLNAPHVSAAERIVRNIYALS